MEIMDRKCTNYLQIEVFRYRNSIRNSVEDEGMVLRAEVRIAILPDTTNQKVDERRGAAKGNRVDESRSSSSFSGHFCSSFFFSFCRFAHYLFLLVFFCFCFVFSLTLRPPRRGYSQYSKLFLFNNFFFSEIYSMH